ncbi:unnamed protein product [Merluccius merluccius]
MRPQGWLMVEFGQFLGQSMKEVYEDKTLKAQNLIDYLVRGDARPNTNIAIFEAHVLKRPCGKHKLTAAGLYQTVRQVLDIDGWYDLATEYLECKGWSKKYPGWSEDILGQLDMGHRSQFPALLTYSLPSSLTFPSLLAVYAKDVLGGLHLVKAKITFIFGSVLKMGSTKKVTKKLAGASAGVATEAHPLYGIFMARLSTCIFEWDPEDVAALRRAKEDHQRIQHIWQEQEKHVACIQDPEDFQLYTKTGTLNKGGVELCCYREWLQPTQFLWHLTNFHHRRNNCSSFLQHQAHSMNLSSLQIWRGRLLICGQADAQLLSPGSAPSHLPPLHQTLHGSCQLLGCCLQLLVPQHPAKAQRHLFLLQLLLFPVHTEEQAPSGP